MDPDQLASSEASRSVSTLFLKEHNYYFWKSYAYSAHTRSDTVYLGHIQPQQDKG